MYNSYSSDVGLQQLQKFQFSLANDANDAAEGKTL